MAEERHLFDEQGRELIVDTYGYAFVVGEGKPRHPKCRCEVPCQERFRCRSGHHVGSRSTPWCTGGSESESCDDCWYVEDKRKEKIRKMQEHAQKEKELEYFVRQVERLRKEGATTNAIAKQLGVARTTVNDRVRAFKRLQKRKAS